MGKITGKSFNSGTVGIHKEVEWERQGENIITGISTKISLTIPKFS